jgi:phosphatidylserine/phosphatidylglycerophosphate/cardiolipin synthase-like enzyme
MTRPKSIRRIALVTFAAAWLITLLWNVYKPMPPGTDIESPQVRMSMEQVRFLHDMTARDADGNAVVSQQIFDAVFAVIDEAQHFIVLDFFLFNSDMAASTMEQRPLSRQLADRLLARKRVHPALQILLITDPINDVYGGRPSALLQELTDAGIDVVRTDLTALRDSNALYSAAWRMVPQWFGNSSSGGWLPDPFKQGNRITLRSYLSLANFKANHRKVLIADRPNGEWTGIVASANPHDASSLHSNVAVQVSGDLAEVMLASELDIARLSGWRKELQPPKRIAQQASATTAVTARYVTEQAIRSTLLARIDATQAGDSIALAMFYLSDRKIVTALLRAAERKVNVRLILDANKDAFGLEKDGVPNRPVANELVTASNNAIEVRWYRTQGEQFHTKLALIQSSNTLVTTLGSANFTRRNIGNYNLEANIELEMPVDSALSRQFIDYFDMLWSNRGAEFTLPFDAYRDDSTLHYWRYRLMEVSGLSTF